MRLKHDFVFVLLAVISVAQPVPSTSAETTPSGIPSKTPPTHNQGECDACIRANLSYLASPMLRGRGSGTEDEHRAAQFIAAKLKQYGLSPAAEKGAYIQTANIQSRTVTAPTLSFDVDEASKPRAINWEHGKEITIFYLAQPDISGALQKLDSTDSKTTPEAVKDGAVLLLKLKPGASLSDSRAAVGPYMQSKATMIIVPESPAAPDALGKAPKLPSLPKKVGEETLAGKVSVVVAKEPNFEQLWALSEGTIVKLHADVSPWTTTQTWNVLAKLDGSESNQVILLSAHLDHLGVQHGKIYPGADDDASGTTAVMELARALAKAQKPKRTVVFALWGSEEAGMIGSQYFLKHPTFELKDVVANLEFEMIGRPDSKLKENQLWLSGWERTNLGPTLAAHGAKLVADPHPDQGFFERSDNYALAKQGLIAQTVSSFGLHKDYHRPSDSLAKIDWQHLDESIGSMIVPVMWLANSDFVPQWNEGKKP